MAILIKERREDRGEKGKERGEGREREGGIQKGVCNEESDEVGGDGGKDRLPHKGATELNQISGRSRIQRGREGGRERGREEGGRRDTEDDGPEGLNEEKESHHVPSGPLFELTVHEHVGAGGG